MNKVLIFYFFTLLLGIVLALHLAMNSEVGKGIGNPRVANAVFWCIGALGACLVFAIIWLIPQVGARALFINLLAGQVFGAMILSHFGWLGSPVQRVTPVHVVGALVMMLGVVLATYAR